MAVGRVLIAVLLSFGVFGPALLSGEHRRPMDCCPDGETMQCCRNQSGCSFERCDGSEPLPIPISTSGFVLPVRPQPISPDRSGFFPDMRRCPLPRPLLDQPDPPPRA